MKKKFILPAAFALTLHAFLLFGLTDKPAPAAVASGDPQPKDKRDLLPFDTDNADTENPGDGDESHSGRQAKTTPRSWDMTPIDPPPGAPIVPRLPPVPGDGSANVIPTDWQLPGGPGGGPHTTVCNLKDLDCLPRARSQPAPIYPADLLGQGIEGTVVVEFIVDLEQHVLGRNDDQRRHLEHQFRRGPGRGWAVEIRTRAQDRQESPVSNERSGGLPYRWQVIHAGRGLAACRTSSSTLPTSRFIPLDSGEKSVKPPCKGFFARRMNSICKPQLLR